jgi:hypothetical protein
LKVTSRHRKLAYRQAGIKMEASRFNEGLNIELSGCFNPDEDKIVFIPNVVRRLHFNVTSLTLK